MKQFFLPVLCAMVAVLSFSSCSENFDVAAPYKNITVVYGLLDVNDTAHYVRIQKGFMDQTKSALTMAKVADSSFYPNLTVKVEEMSGSSIRNTYTLTRVDLTAEGYPKDSGTFFTTPNYAYKFKAPLSPDFVYRLVITNPATGETDSADAPVISNDPNAYSLAGPFTTSNAYLDIEHTSPNSTTLLAAGTYPPNAYIVETQIKFHYYDSNLITGAETPKSAIFSFGEVSGAPGGSFVYKVKNVDIYSAMASAIGPPANSNIVRMLDSSELYIYSASQEFLNYLNISATQNSGLTGQEVKTAYTNIRGANVVGLFAGRSFIRDSIVGFSRQSVDSLRINPITAGLQIRGISNH
ncbi:MAG: hypothetical protein H0X33_06100 [Taibaiella sp.]|nr:hypothetical protein [Taibaiella sp.]